MLKATNQHENANYITKRQHLAPVGMAAIGESKDSKCRRGRRGRGGRGPRALLGDCALLQPRWDRVRRLLKKLKAELPDRPAVPPRGIYLKNFQTPTHAPLCSLQYYLQQPRAGSNLSGRQWTAGQRGCGTSRRRIVITRPQKGLKPCHLRQHGWIWRLIVPGK